jgi:hypothetical protein
MQKSEVKSQEPEEKLKMVESYSFWLLAPGSWLLF